MPRVTIAVPGVAPQPYRFPIERHKIRLGRALDNDIVIDSPSVSQHHAEIERSHDGYVLRDLGSTNGIKLNDHRAAKINLAEPGRVALGDVGLEFELSSDEAAAIDAETPRLPKLPEAPAAEPTAETPALEDDEPVTKPRKSRSRKEEKPSYDLGSLVTLVLIAIIAVLVGAALRHYQLRGSQPQPATAPAQTAPATPGN